MANPRQGDFATRRNAKPQQRFRTQSKNAVTDASLLDPTRDGSGAENLDTELAADRFKDFWRD
jgi:hypothetical protein